MVLAPTVLWAQRKDKLFLTIDVQDAHEPTVKLTNDPEKKSGHLAFKGAAASHATGPEPHSYELDLELFGEVDEEESKVSVGQRYITLVIAKKDKDSEEHWPRLLKAKGKTPTNIKVDWDKWVDEDEEDEAPDPTAGMDMSSLMSGMGGGGGGMPGMPGGMGGMGGGGMGGMDIQSMLAGMGGGGGGMPGGMGGMDLSSMDVGGAGMGGGDEDSDDDEADEPPSLPED